MMSRTIACIAAACLLASSPGAAQDRPAGPTTRLLVGFPAGGGVDLLARVLAAALQTRLGRPVEVENRGGDIAVETVARAAPDGATLGFATPSVAIARHVTRNPRYDPRNDLTPISIFADVPIVVLVSPDLPARDLRGLGEALKTTSVACSTAGAGSFLHLTTVLLTRSLDAGCAAVHYRDPTVALADLQSGKVQLYVNLVSIGLPAARDGRARALAVTSGRRLASAPEVPTVAEAGLPGFEVQAWMALVGPRGLPEPLAARLEQAAREAARDPAVADRLRALGAEPVGSTGAEFAAKLRTEDARWGEAARTAGLTVD